MTLPSLPRGLVRWRPLWQGMGGRHAVMLKTGNTYLVKARSQVHLQRICAC
jgi:hypothetical protein